MCAAKRNIVYSYNQELTVHDTSKRFLLGQEFSGPDSLYEVFVETDYECSPTGECKTAVEVG